ncbi:MAG: cytochrome c biogenesis protein CcsA [Candidatus Thermoplasmatota archaeon]|nr:cytochrome c biogenesis protein CcsA [Candidatus Thermoplasmatota archaeon]
MAHELNSIMLYIHPLLAVLGHVLVFASLYPSLCRKTGKLGRAIPLISWLFVLSGLVSGMVWAQLAWGAYWSWDPKETATLLLFAGVSAHAHLFYRSHGNPASRKAILVLSALNCTLALAAVLVTWLAEGLHSYT